MSNIADYQIKERLHKDTHTVIYRAIRITDQLPVIIKATVGDHPNSTTVNKLEREYRLLKLIDNPNVSQVIDFIKTSHKTSIILHDKGGIVLSDYLAGKAMEVSKFLSLAIQLASIVGFLHQQNLIHKDIKPENILINPETKNLTLIDFSIVSQLSNEIQALINPEVLEGTLNYMSPEQTGRMGCSVDYRTDLYALGVCFYQMLTGKLPFSAKDAIGLVHAHLAKKVSSPSKINPEIPTSLSRIILKLLKKHKEDRYQSAFGLQKDLELCLEEFNEHKAISDFIPGKYDVPSHFIVSQKLYGRQTELTALLKQYQKAIQGESILLTVTGFSGVGKTALVNELHKPIAAKHGYFCTGKFDQLQRSEQYRAWTQALTHLVKQILTENEENLAVWRNELLQALGNNAQVIIDLIPELELIIGKQKKLAQLNLQESQNRFELAFYNLLKLFAKAYRPLVIFLDDLQWADISSIHLLELLSDRYKIPHLMLILAYRRNEVAAAHPLTKLLNDVEDKIHLERILLRDISQDAVNHLIADTVHTNPVKTKELTSIIIQKAGGNPFFIKQLLEYCYSKRMIKFDLNNGKWTWDIENIQNQKTSKNIVELMIARLTKLPQMTQSILTQSACIGNEFDLNTLFAISDLQKNNIVELLWPSIQENFITANDDGLKKNSDFTNENIHFKFTHDRIQQAAYSLINKNEQKQIHLQIARCLKDSLNEEELDRKCFLIADQFNYAKELITLQKERNRAAELNLIAAKKAKSSAAFKAAYSYINNAHGFLYGQSWEDNYDLTLAIYENSAELSAILYKFSEMEEYSKTAILNAHSILEKVSIYEIKLTAHVLKREYLEAIDLGLDILKMLGLKLPKHPNKLHVIAAVVRLKRQIRNKDVPNLVNLPILHDKKQLAIMRILTRMTTHVFLAKANLAPLVSVELISRSIRYGNSSYSTTAYISAIILFWIIGDIKKSKEFGELAINLLARIPDKRRASFTTHIYSSFLLPWIQDLHDISDRNFKAYYLGLEYGDLEFAGFSLSLAFWFQIYAGRPLDEIQKQLEAFWPRVLQNNHQNSIAALKLLNQFIYNLRNPKEDPEHLSGEFFDENIYLPIHKKANELNAYSTVHSIKLYLSYLFQKYEKGIMYSNQILANYIPGYVSLANATFFKALCIFKYANDKNHWQKTKALFKTKKLIKQYKKWSTNAPANFQHRYYVLLAERYRLKQKYTQAIKYYDLAIREAKKNDFLQDLAIISELIGEFYIEMDANKIASQYITDAYFYYKQWAADAKVQNLEQRFGNLIDSEYKLEVSKTKDPTLGKSTFHGLEFLDLSTVIKVTQVISKEVKLRPLIINIVNLMIENVGADTACLILNKNNKLYVEAYCNSENKISGLLRSTPVEEYNKLPRSIIDYVSRTKEFVLLNDINKNNRFLKDKYFRRSQVKTALCFPIIQHNDLIGIIYFENNQAVNAFTSNRIKLLEIISAQAAISIENARLYHSFERFVPKQFLTLIGQRSIVDVELGDSLELTLTTLFMDIRGFTQLAERKSANEVFKFINKYLSYMEPVITRNHGFIDKYIGDAIMALFPSNPENAIHAAIELLNMLDAFNAKYAEEFGEIKAGIAVNTGKAMLGTIGSKHRLDETVISDSVNLAARLESANKFYNTQILLSEHTIKTSKKNANFKIRLIDKVQVRGKTQATNIYEVLDSDDSSEMKLQYARDTEQAIKLYQAGEFRQALAIFQQCQKMLPEDALCQLYIERCKHYLKNKPSETWNGVTTLN